MIKSVEFINYTNLNQKFEFNNTLNIIFGNNNFGKTNLLEGIRLAFSTITNDYFKISKRDFKNSDDTVSTNIKVELEVDSIPSLNFFDENGKFFHLGYVPRYSCKELLNKLNQNIKYSAMIQSVNLESQLNDENITASVKLILNI